MTIYRSALISRRPTLDEQQFHRHWIEVHGPLASRLPGVGSYRQNHIAERIHEATDTTVQTIDGVSQLAFDSIEAMERSDASPQYAAVKKDIALFQAEITVLVLEADELVAGDDRGEYAKLLWVSTQRASKPDPDLRSRWLSAHRGSSFNVPGLRRYVQNFVVDRDHAVHAGIPAGDARGVEAVSEMWFDEPAALHAALASETGWRLVYGDELLRPVGVYRMEEIRIRA